MSYSPTTWVEGQTTLGPTNMNKLEQGLAAVSAGLTLATSTNTGDRSLSFSGPSFVAPVGRFIAVDVGTINCEVRKVTAASGSTLTLASPLQIAHASGVAIVSSTGPVIPVSWYGAQEAGPSFDNEPYLQAAFDDASYHQLGLSGGHDSWGASYYIGMPLVQCGELHLQHFNFVAKSSFGPLDNNGAMLQMADVRSTPYLTVTGAAATSTFTTSVAHGMSNGYACMFKGTMPGGITAGRRYYVINATSTTFQVSLTVGGAAVTITSDGSCRLYCSLQALLRWFLQDVLIDGQNIAPVGMRCLQQQQGENRRVRIQYCTYKHAVIGGQDGRWDDLEILGHANAPHSTLLELNTSEEGQTPGGSIFQRFNQLNLEGYYDCGLRAYGTNTNIHNLHMEGGNNGCVAVEVHCETLSFTGDTLMNLDVGNSQTRTFFRVISGDFVAHNINAPSASGTTSILLDDQVQGNQVLLSDVTGGDTSAAIRLLDSGFKGSNQSGINYQYLIRGAKGRQMWFGACNPGSHSIILRAEPSQTGGQLQIQDSTGAEVAHIDAKGIVKGPVMRQGIVTLAYSPSIVTDASAGSWQIVTATNATAFVFGSVLNPPSATESQELTIEVFNNSGGALGLVTFNSPFKMAGYTWTSPATGFRRNITFRWNGTNWIAVRVSAADY